MKTLNTVLGPVTITDARIQKASGYGQYTIIIEIEFEGKKITIKEHSNDSRLFDKAYGEDDHAAIVMEDAKNIIEDAVDDYIHSL
jgi:hypothetical protein